MSSLLRAEMIRRGKDERENQRNNEDRCRVSHIPWHDAYNRIWGVVMLSAAASRLVVATLLTLSATAWHPGGGDFKCYEDYRCITSVSSPQYQLQLEARTDDYGLRRIGQFYCVALGSAYGSEIGAKYIITLSSNQEIPVVLADQKADRDTVEGHTRDRLGAVVEFVVDSARLPWAVRQSGNVGSIPGFEGEIVEIRRLEE